MRTTSPRAWRASRAKAARSATCGKCSAPTTKDRSTCMRRSRCARPPAIASRPPWSRPVRRGPALRLPGAVRSHRRDGQEEGTRRHRRAPVRQLRQGHRRRRTRCDQEPLLPLRHAVGPDGVDRRRPHPEGQAGVARRLRGPGRQGREPVPSRHHHRRRAPPAGGAHLDRCHRRGAGGDGEGVQGAAVQPHRHDGVLGCSRQHDADASDRRHARSRGQPSR